MAMSPAAARPGGRGRSREAVEAREAAILEAALRLLEDGGFGAVTTDAIAARADVSKATIYRKWSNKTELVVAALGRVFDESLIVDTGSFTEDIRVFLQHRLEQFTAPGVDRMFAGIIGQCAEDEALADAFYAWVHNTMRGNFDIIERARERGDIVRSVPASVIATMIAAPLTYRLVWEHQKPDQELVDGVVHILERALVDRAPATTR